MSESKYLVEVKNLKQYFPITTGFMKSTMLKAVDDVSSPSRRAKRSVWSASPAAARPPSAARCCTCTSPPAVRFSLTAKRSARRP